MDLRRAFFLFLSLIVTTQVWAQISGGLTGQVTDPSGASIAGAPVTLTRTSTGVEAKDSDNGGGLLHLRAAITGELLGGDCGAGLCKGAAARHHG